MRNIETAKTIADDILLGKVSEYEPQYIIDNLLKTADDTYFNIDDVDGDTFIEDQKYDTIKQLVRAMDPTNVYFTGVGSDIRGEKVPLPYPMGSLDQVYDDTISDWLQKHDIETELLCITEKLDGISVLLIYDEGGMLQIAYSRGNGIEGADITRHVRKIQAVPKHINLTKVAIRAEIIIPLSQFPKLQAGITNRAGKEYKNPRNMIAGLMNAKENPDWIYTHIDVVAYEIIGNNDNKTVQINSLDQEGFIVPWYMTTIALYADDDLLSDIISKRRKDEVYEIDGIVIDVDESECRIALNPTRDTLNPAYSVKYKIADVNNTKHIEVIDVEWNISKHGYLKPKVQVKPTQVGGVTIQNATGFNAKFIVDNKIGPGAIVQITRSGDVIPFIEKVITPGIITSRPNVAHYWNETNVDMIVEDYDNHPEVKTQQIIDFFMSIGVPHLREGNIRKFIERMDTFALEDFIRADTNTWQNIIGANGKKIHEGMQATFSNISIDALMGSTSFFGRGVGKRKFKKLMQHISFDQLKSCGVETISEVDTFDVKTANKIIEGLPNFLEWLNTIEDVINVNYDSTTSNGKLTGHKVCFTGFRDKVLQNNVELLGGSMQSAVSSKTTILVASNPNSSSGKMKKAREIEGIQIFSIDDFKEYIND